MLEIGEVAPDFELPGTGGEKIHLADALQQHRAIVVAFYVLDFTPG